MEWYCHCGPQLGEATEDTTRSPRRRAISFSLSTAPPHRYQSATPVIYVLPSSTPAPLDSATTRLGNHQAHSWPTPPLLPTGTNCVAYRSRSYGQSLPTSRYSHPLSAARNAWSKLTCSMITSVWEPPLKADETLPRASTKGPALSTRRVKSFSLT